MCKVTNVTVHDCFDSSDHAIITFDFDIPVPSRHVAPDQCLSFRKAKWSLFRRFLYNSHPGPIQEAVMLNLCRVHFSGKSLKVLFRRIAFGVHYSPLLK